MRLSEQEYKNNCQLGTSSKHWYAVKIQLEEGI